MSCPYELTKAFTSLKYAEYICIQCLENAAVLKFIKSITKSSYIQKILIFSLTNHACRGSILWPLAFRGGVPSVKLDSMSVLFVENTVSRAGTFSRHSTRDVGRQLKRMMDGSTRIKTTTSTGKEVWLTMLPREL